VTPAKRSSLGLRYPEFAPQSRTIARHVVSDMRWAETRKSQTRQVGAYTTKRLLQYLASLLSQASRPGRMALLGLQNKSQPHTNARPGDLSTSSAVQHPGIGAGKYLSPAVECQREASASLETPLYVYASGVSRRL
jgi:hypothetical protein